MRTSFALAHDLNLNGRGPSGGDVNLPYEAREQQIAALKGAAKSMTMLAQTGSDPFKSERARSYMDAAQLLARSDPFYWTPKCGRIIQSMFQKFADEIGLIDTTRYLLHADCEWHYFAEPWFTLDQGTYTADVKAISWGWAKSSTSGTYGFSMFAWVQPPEVQFLAPSLYASREEGLPFFDPNAPIHFAKAGEQSIRAETEQLLRFCIVGSMFLRQKLFDVTRPKNPRNVDRRFKREAVPLVDTQFVQMRAKHYDRKEPTGEERDWQWRWTVKAHIRKQWYASIGAHLPILIDEYEKGPADKPLKPRTTQIMVVSR